ncbi:MAG: RNA pyrophosphohydrolase [Alphaproteobacteria bacterium]|nr:RNA pyrophosphohydrolase [Alphaproteobacteria bacterium]
MLINRDGLVFAAKRIDTLAEAWQMPQGGIDEGEDPRAAAMRELEEEIGTNKAEIVAESKTWLSYDLPEHLVGQLWGGKYRGQQQKWFAMRFLGTDGDINIATKHPEFSEWKWTPRETLPDLIVPFKRALYQSVVSEFSSLFSSI